MRTASDLMLILEPDPDSKAVLCAVADRLGCEHVATDSPEALHEILAIRRPTIAVLAVDGINAKGLAVLDALASHDSRPAILLVGTVDARVLASTKRTASSRGLAVLGVASRPFDTLYIERLLAPYLSVAPPVSRDELTQAIAEHELTLLYQPKLALSPAAVGVIGVEALVRWQHPRRGLLQPRHFLPATEEYGLMMNLTDFVLTEAVRQAALWRTRGMSLQIVVNLSPRLVKDRAFPERLAVLLEENEFPPQQVMFDVIEAPNDSDQDLLLDVFTRLRILGVGLSLDNFGTGLSSLTELYRLPFSEIKVDHTLIADVPREHEARVVVQAIVNLAHALQLVVCAEGVETSEMFEFARSAGFDLAQGRFFSEPVQASDIEKILQTWPSTGPAATDSWRPLKATSEDGFMKTHVGLRARRVEGKVST